MSVAGDFSLQVLIIMDSFTKRLWVSRALAEALQVPHSVIKLNARVMEALEKQGCEGRWGERDLSKRHRQGQWRGALEECVCLWPHLPTRQKDQTWTQLIQMNKGSFYKH